MKNGASEKKLKEQKSEKNNFLRHYSSTLRVPDSRNQKKKKKEKKPVRHKRNLFFMSCLNIILSFSLYPDFNSFSNPISIWIRFFLL